MEILALPVTLGRVKQVILVIPVEQEILVTLVMMDLLASKEKQVILEGLGILEEQEIQVILETPAM